MSGFAKILNEFFLQKKVSDSQKKKETARFMAKKQINKVNGNDLSVTNYRENASNLLTVIDKFIPPLTRK